MAQRQSVGDERHERQKRTQHELDFEAIVTNQRRIAARSIGKGRVRRADIPPVRELGSRARSSTRAHRLLDCQH